MNHTQEKFFNRFEEQIKKKRKRKACRLIGKLTDGPELVLDDPMPYGFHGGLGFCHDGQRKIRAFGGGEREREGGVKENCSG